MSTDNTILREQLRQQERKQQKAQKSMLNKKAKYYEAQNRKKEIAKSETITVSDYKKLGDDSAKRKATERAWEWFSRSIRLRDIIAVNDKLFWVCIACGKKEEVQFYSNGSIMNTKLWNSSHCFRQDLYESIKFDRINNNLSCYNCNRNLAGNLNLYKINLIKKVGQLEFDKLERRRNSPKHFNILELIKIKEESMEITKEELKRLGIKL